MKTALENETKTLFCSIMREKCLICKGWRHGVKGKTLTAKAYPVGEGRAAAGGGLALSVAKK